MAWLKKPTWRLIVVYALMALLFVVSAPTPWSLAVGIPLIVAGEALRIWACGHLVKNRRLTTTGPYAHVKNPLYVGTILISVGFCIAARAWPVLVAVVIGYYGYYFPRKKKIEGDRLRQIYGEAWVRYDASVPDLLPRPTPYRSGDTTRFDGRLVFANSEHGTVMSIAVGFLLMFLCVWMRQAGILSFNPPWIRSL